MQQDIAPEAMIWLSLDSLLCPVFVLCVSLRASIHPSLIRGDRVGTVVTLLLMTTVTRQERGKKGCDKHEMAMTDHLILKNHVGGIILNLLADVYQSPSKILSSCQTLTPKTPPKHQSGPCLFGYSG